MNKRYPKTIMATACIPWDKEYRFREDIFRREVRHIISGGIRSIYIFGTAGEGYAVDDRMFVEIAKVFADEMKGPNLLPMIGVISLSLVNVKRCLKTSGTQLKTHMKQ